MSHLNPTPTQPRAEDLDATVLPASVDGLGITMASSPGLPVFERGGLVGRYVILSLIGRGAMGVVYAAYDPELERKVAIKVLPLGEARTGAATRLLREAQALAKLSHPHVVAVHDVGSLNDNIWIAMEFVDGQTLSRWLAASQRTWREIIDVFIAAGEGLAAAHDTGLVHRDFKPDNVMVSKSHRVRVMDFGLARNEHLPTEPQPIEPGLNTPTADQSATLPGTILGTPRYMAPEQWKAQTAGAQADQFSYCVTLWEALYGDLPFAGATLHELALSVTSGKLRLPSTQRKVPRRLRPILVRGLSVAPDQRWPSMRALLGALSRERPWRTWLLGSMLLGGLSASYILVAPATAASCTGNVALKNIWEPAQREAIAKSFGATGLPYANYTFTKIVADLDRYAGQLESRFESLCHARVGGVRADRALDLQAACLERNRSAFAAAVDVFAHADAKVVGNAAQLTSRLPSLDRCADYTALIAESQQMAPPTDPSQIFAVDEQRARLSTAKAELDANNFEKSLSTAKEIVVQAERIGYRPLLAEALVANGAAIQFGGDYIEATNLVQRGYSIAEESAHDVVASDAAMRLVHLYGQRHLQAGTALMWSEVAKAKFVRLNDDGRRLGRLMLFTGGSLVEAGRMDESEPYYRKGLELAERHQKADPSFYSIALNEVGNRELSRGELDAAEHLFRRSLQIRRSTFGEDHPHVAVSLHNLALVLYNRRQFGAAAEGFKRALTIRERRFGPGHPSSLESLNGLGAALLDSGRTADGIDIFRRALALGEQRGIDGIDLFAPLNNLGNALINEGRIDEAGVYIHRAKELLEKAGQAETADYALVLYNLGAVYVQSDAPRGVPIISASLAIRERIYGDQHIEVGVTLSYLAWANLKSGQYAQAEQHANRAILVLTQHPPGILELGRARFALAQVLGRNASTIRPAIAMARQAILDLQNDRSGMINEAVEWLTQVCSTHPTACLAE